MKKEIIIITGANGMVAKALSKRLKTDYELRFLTRKKTSKNEFEWNVHQKTIDENVFDNAAHIIHLAGANIFEKRWSPTQKEEIINSRVDSAKLILECLKVRNQHLKSFVSSSAVGFYGAITSEHIFKEEDASGNDFLAEVVRKWEAAADEFELEKIVDRVVKLRTGVVFSEKGGALEKMVNPVKNGFGSALGSGKQYIPWLHIDDLCGIYKKAIEDENFHGVFNAVAPQHINNNDLTKAIAQQLNKTLWLPNVPSFILKLVFGEASSMILEGSRVSSEKLENIGFHFKYPNLEKALPQLLHN